MNEMEFKNHEISNDEYLEMILELSPACETSAIAPAN